MSASAVSVEGVSKVYRLYKERNDTLKATILRGGRVRYDEFPALTDVSLEVPEGTTFGLIGENGSGKSTLLKCMARILTPDAGVIRTRGRVAALLELGSGFHPELTGRENVFLNGTILGMSSKALRQAFDEIVSFAGIEAFIDQPVKNYSSGMYVRLAFSVAINVDPDILLVDEVLAVGDAVFQRRCNEKFFELRNSGKTIVVVSHATDQMRTLCDEVAWLDHGVVQQIGPPPKVIDTYVDQGREDLQVVQHGDRWGSGEIQLTQVEVLDASGRPISGLRTGDAMTIRLSYTCAHRIPSPVFGVALETVEGIWLWAHNTRDADYVPESLEGTGTIDLVIERLALQPGTFELSASVVDRSFAHVYDYHRRCIKLEVETGTPRESGGYVVLGGTWRGLDVPAPDPGLTVPGVG